MSTVQHMTIGSLNICVWLCIGVYGCDGCVYVCKDVYRRVHGLYGCYGHVWVCMGVYGYICVCMGGYGYV